MSGRAIPCIRDLALESYALVQVLALDVLVSCRSHGVRYNMDLVREGSSAEEREEGREREARRGDKAERLED